MTKKMDGQLAVVTGGSRGLGEMMVRAFAAEMSADEQRHIARLETLLARETVLAATQKEEGDEAGDGVSFP